MQSLYFPLGAPQTLGTTIELKKGKRCDPEANHIPPHLATFTLHWEKGGNNVSGA